MMPYFILLLSLLSFPANAQIYRCGEHCYTDHPQFSHAPIALTTPHHYTEANRPTPAPHANNKKNNTASIPKTTSTRAPTPLPQRSHSHSPSRQEILRGELLNEYNALTQAQQRLNEIKKHQPSSNEAGRLHAEITERKHNIQALQKELNQR